MRGIAVRGESADQVKSRLAARNYIKDSRGRDTPGDLGDNIGPQVRSGESFTDHQAQGNRWIQVASRDMPDGVGHRKHSQSERQSHAQQANADVGERGSQDGTAASAENKPKGADELSYRSFA
jgi:hypothetical protein